jgi:MFS family permease
MDRNRRDLYAITADGVAFSVMVGAGETYVPAFALAMGLGEVTAGWVVTIPLLAGAVLQLVSPGAVARMRSVRAWVVLCAAIQALSMAGFMLLAIRGIATTASIYAVAAVYWGAGLATGPAWNAWVGRLVPRPMRTRYFARRSRLCQGAVLVALVAGGVALQGGLERGDVAGTFVVLFAVAFAARAISAALLASQREPKNALDGYRVVPIRRALVRSRGTAEGRLLLYMLLIQGAVQVSGPFFTPYMLKELHFSYDQYLMVIGAAFLTKMLVLPFVGGIVHRIGSRPALVLAGFGIVPTSALWLISDELAFLIGVQVVAGAIWAIYELTTFLLLFDHIDESERTSVLTTYNLIHAVMTVVGAVAGGSILHLLAESRAGYLTLFGLSGGLRLLTVPLLLRIGRIPVERYEMAVGAMAVRPNTGSMDAPIVPSGPADRAAGGHAHDHEGR